jgi:hypothetical protein
MGEAFQQQGFGELGAKLAVVLAATESSHDQWPLGEMEDNGGTYHIQNLFFGPM